MRYLRIPLSTLVGLAILTGVLVVSRGEAARDPGFNPTFFFEVSQSEPGVSADIACELGLEAPDRQFDLVIIFTPPEWGVARDADVPDGAIVADVKSEATLSIINNACDERLEIAFEMLEATTDASATVPLSDPEGAPHDDIDEQFDIGPDGLPLGVTRYPDYLTRILSGLTPISRAYGQTIVAGMEVSLNLVTFEPGGVFQTSDGPVAIDPRFGYPTAVILQDYGDPEAVHVPRPITDFCSPLSASTTVLGVSQDNPSTTADESGFVLRTNPGDGEYFWVVYAVSQRDADDDGIENTLDTCPLDVSAGDPRVRGSGDADGDGLDAACDPNDDPGTEGLNSDQDMDGYLNRQDNCPLNPNGEDGENQADSDRDGIGDRCDPNLDRPDGDNKAVCMVNPMTIGSGGPRPHPQPQDMQPCDPDAPLPTPTPAADELPPTGGERGRSDGAGIPWLVGLGAALAGLGSAVLVLVFPRRGAR